MTAKKKILICIEWFLPGYRAGGPIQSCVNLIEHLKDEYDFSVLTTNVDYSDDKVYQNIKSDEWNILPNGMRVYYFSKNKLNRKNLQKVLHQEEFDIYYFNGVYSRYFTLLPLIYLRKKGKQLIVASRGMLSPNALAVKSFKKNLFLQIVNRINFFDGVLFHATTTEEARDIRLALGEHVNVKIVSNLPKKGADETSLQLKKKKISGELFLVSIARIAPEKNLKFSLEVLKKAKGQITFHIYGPVYNTSYWQDCLRVIQEMPSNVKIEYKGSIDREDVQNTLLNYHFLFMPTLGENFGHSILEAMHAGCPVIISDATPWKNLEQKKAGWDIPLNQPDDFVHVIEKCLIMNGDEYLSMAENTRSFVLQSLNIANIIEGYKNLFNSKKKILIFADWYLPGYKAGGPIISVANIVQNLKGTADFAILTRNKDHGENNPYPNIQSDSWIKTPDGVDIYYSSKKQISLKLIYKILKTNKFSTVYLNSMFSYYFSIIPIITHRIFFPGIKIIIAPRGMLGAGALQKKRSKKKMFLFYSNLFNIYKNIIWHASTSYEEMDINRAFGDRIKVMKALNIPSVEKWNWRPREKSRGELKLVFISRIAIKKNLLFAIDILSVLSKIDRSVKIVFDIYGPIEDAGYWLSCKQKIDKLSNENICINYKGDLVHQLVVETLKNYHLLLFPTQNENFGHIIIESLNAGCPVMISDQTPWRNLEGIKIGWDISLESSDLFIKHLHQLAIMEKEEFNIWSKNAYEFSLQYLNNSEVIEQNKKLFLEA